MFKKLFSLNNLSTLLLQTSILTFIIAFNFTDNPSGGWYQQFLPDVGSGQLQDITFLDSLTGFGVIRSPSYVIKTTDGGNNWFINYAYSQPFYGLQFLNKDTGYVLSFNQLLRTTDNGNNWSIINLPPDLAPDNIWVLNFDTIWAAQSEGLVGGIFLTTDGGVSWSRKFYEFANNPGKIYFYNKNLGFATNGNLLRTSNGGVNWNYVNGAGDFYDIYFIDSLIGWKAFGISMRKTIDGGLNWIYQDFPDKSNNFLISRINNFTNINKDTILGVGGVYRYSNNFTIRGVIYKTTNGGQNWGYQIPDTNIRIGQYDYISFVNKFHGWAYSKFDQSGVHTTIGGEDTTYYVNINHLGSEIKKYFILYQNYPNPFNPKTIINYELKVANYVHLKVYDITGKLIKELINEKQNAGTYKAGFDGSGLNSGVYFYKLVTIDNKSKAVFSETKKMLLIK